MDNAANISEYSSKEKRFLKITFYTICSLFLLILAGGVVRSTGSGMGCPDWPKCFDQLVPPTSVSQLPANYEQAYVNKRIEKNNRFANLLNKIGFAAQADRILKDQSVLKSEQFNVWNTYTEYVNRLIGAITGLFMLAMTIAAFAIRKNNRSVFAICLGSLVLVVLQAWIGSWVVSTNLTSWVITVHMFLALVIIGLVMLAYQNVKYKNLPDLKLSAKKLRTAELFTWLSLTLCTAQILFGTELRESVDQQAAFWNQTNRASWVALSGEVFNIHKGFSLLLTLTTIICSGYILEHFKEIKRLISYVMVIITIMALQIITGIVLAYFNLPPAMQTLHLFFASLLIGAWVLQLALLANYRKSISMAIII